jgi:hypothetical protein
MPVELWRHRSSIVQPYSHLSFPAS